MLIALLAAAPFAHPNLQPPPTLPVQVYQDRRERVMEALDGCATAISAQGKMGGGVTAGFRQDDDFFWLTGINEPEAWLILFPKSKTTRSVVFLRPRDPEAERWTGPRDQVSPALKAKLGVDEVRRGNGGPRLLQAAPLHDCLAIISPANDLKDDRSDVQAIRQAATAMGLRTVYKRTLLARLREGHGPEELALMRKAIDITRQGHEAAARATVAGMSEREVQTQIETAFFENGATGVSYGTIVGSGVDGAVLHWVENTRVLKEGDLVVIDAAAEYGRYAADVTRTYPVSGRFTDEQAKVYRAVYQAQEDILAAIKPGVTMADLQKVAEASLNRAGYLDKFIHGFGHFVGLDVHDVGQREQPILPGAVITVEPGIYLPEQGFGVRIEDEVEILPDGKWRLLTSAFPRKLEDVEAWVARARATASGHAR
jgi:Xaa-Pro aminopeptidase